MARHAPLEERFWAKVDKSRGPAGCWLWLGSRLPKGYGTLHHQGKRCYAHRIAYTLAIGPIPEGLEIDHVYDRGCTYRHCVNPAHLEPVTHKENNRRSNSITAQQSRQTHCVHGHAFTSNNTRITKSNGRKCRACGRDYYHRVRAARRMDVAHV